MTSVAVFALGKIYQNPGNLARTRRVGDSVEQDSDGGGRRRLLQGEASRLSALILRPSPFDPVQSPQE
jgi:hypothetical protein